MLKVNNIQKKLNELAYQFSSQNWNIINDSNVSSQELARLLKNKRMSRLNDFDVKPKIIAYTKDAVKNIKPINELEIQYNVTKDDIELYNKFISVNIDNVIYFTITYVIAILIDKHDMFYNIPITKAFTIKEDGMPILANDFLQNKISEIEDEELKEKLEIIYNFLFDESNGQVAFIDILSQLPYHNEVLLKGDIIDILNVKCPLSIATFNVIPKDDSIKEYYNTTIDDEKIETNDILLKDYIYIISYNHSDYIKLTRKYAKMLNKSIEDVDNSLLWRIYMEMLDNHK